MKIALLCLALAGCATQPQCLERDYNARPNIVTVPMNGMLVSVPVYPCTRMSP
jgi:starvation-inducible outer membrane lipoprotein